MALNCLSYDKRERHTSIILKETQLNIILSNALPLSLRSLIRPFMFKKFENMYVSQALLAPHMYIYGIGIEVPYDFKIVFFVCCVNFFIGTKEKS